MDLSSKKIGSSVNQRNTASQGQRSVGKMSNYGAPLARKQLTEGQVIKGEVIDLRNNEVSLLLDDNTMVTGRLDKVNFLSIGDVCSFKVAEIQPGKISLQALPLSQNALEANTMYKALEEAGLPHNSKNQEVVLSLIRNQMPITKLSILNTLKQCYELKDASVNSIVLLNKFAIPVTQENAMQLDNYQNDAHHLSTELNTCIEAFPGFLKEMALVSEDELGSNTKELFSILGYDGKLGTTTVSNASYAFSSTENKEAFLAILEDFDLPEETKEAILNDSLSLTELKETLDSCLQKAQEIDLRNQNDALSGLSNVDRINPQKIQEALADIPKIVEAFDHSEIHRLNQAYQEFMEDNQLLGSILTLEERTELGKFLVTNPKVSPLLPNVLNGSVTIPDVINALSQTCTVADPAALQNLLNSGALVSLLSSTLKQQWSISTKDLKRENGVKEFYAKVYNQSNKLNTFIQNFLPELEESAFHQEMSAVKGNIDFMQMLNSIFPYVQVPFNANGFSGNADLYVYTKKRDIKNNPKNLTVLLHLSLEHLGNLDVHITMKDNNINNTFFIENEQSKRLVKKNVSLLEDKIRELGYIVHTEFTKTEPKVDIVKDFISQKEPQEEIKRYTFDIRA